MPHRPRKRFGQHFLHDPGVIRRLVELIDPRPGEPMVEIGPGQGALTRHLLPAVGSLDVVELDRDLIPVLQTQCAGSGELRIHHADALRFDFAALARGRAPLRIVGNLPYNISTPLLFHLFGQAEAIRDMHFMLQREVVDRLTAAPGESDYGRLSVMTQYRCRTQRLLTIGAGAFSPPPKVESAFVRLIPYRDPPVPVDDEALLQQVVRTAFSQRRKTLRNALRSLLGAEQIAALGIDPGRRPETLGLDEYARLSRALRQR